MKGQIPDSGQLDLFLHSHTVILANDVIAALLARNVVRAGECLDRFRGDEPGHHLHKPLEILCHTLGEWPFAATNPAEIAATIRRLDADVYPAALAAMSENAPLFMRPLWRDLAHSASPHAYDAAFPHAYSAALYLRCGDAEAAAEAAKAVARHDDNVDALYWLAVARYRIDGLDGCRMPLMRLALLGPERLPWLLCELDDSLLNRDWRAFHAACHWLDTESPTVGAWFPAWHLVEYAGMRLDCGSPATLPTTPASQIFIAIARLLELETHGYSAALISARRRLRALDADMFAFYMTRRDVAHR